VVGLAQISGYLGRLGGVDSIYVCDCLGREGGVVCFGFGKISGYLGRLGGVNSIYVCDCLGREGGCSFRDWDYSLRGCIF
jgi:hypothetical protein